MRNICFVLILISLAFTCSACSDSFFYSGEDGAQNCYDDFYNNSLSSDNSSEESASFYMNADYASLTPSEGNFQQEIDRYINMIHNSPQSPELITHVPGLMTFHGIVGAGRNVYISGYTRVIGGVYAAKNIEMDQCAVIFEDLGCIERVAVEYDKKMDVFNNPALKPLKLSNLPKRPRTLHYTEISPNHYAKSTDPDHAVVKKLLKKLPAR